MNPELIVPPVTEAEIDDMRRVFGKAVPVEFRPHVWSWGATVEIVPVLRQMRVTIYPSEYDAWVAAALAYRQFRPYRNHLADLLPVTDQVITTLGSVLSVLHAHKYAKTAKDVTTTLKAVQAYLAAEFARSRGLPFPTPEISDDPIRQPAGRSADLPAEDRPGAGDGPSPVVLEGPDPGPPPRPI